MKDPISKEAGTVPEDEPRGCPPSYPDMQACARGYPWTLNTYMILKNLSVQVAGGGIYKQVY